MKAVKKSGPRWEAKGPIRRSPQDYTQVCRFMPPPRGGDFESISSILARVMSRLELEVRA